ncbi:TonB-dependent receptor [Shewanella sp. GXUN23E]|uniref:TonB-dependent receptor n=1 Tax=Shewanella sp. GXUN23E TaxID=3422498 RepID=UPI003D7D94DA
MSNALKKNALALAIVAGLGMSGAVFATETTSAIKGFITGPNGQPAVGTKVTIIHVPTGSSKEAVVNEAGLFTTQGLRVGGPYQVVLDSDEFDDTIVNDINLLLGHTYPVNVQLEAKNDLERIEVTGRVISALSGGVGPSVTFTERDLERRPAINRDLKDIVRSDPRIYIDESRGNDAIQCAGGNPRFNSLTLDGVRMNDNFGLNENGYPTIRTPFSYDVLDQVTVELAPFDVQYGGFTSCNFNAVTKSGGNDIAGGVFYDYTNDSMTGDKIEGHKVDLGDFATKRYGVNLGAPIIEDTLFFFGSYEKLEGTQIFEYPGYGDKVTNTDIDRIRQIAKEKYGYDIGGLPGSMPVDDEKLLLKLDWNINDNHRANIIYNYTDGFEISQSDDAVTLDSHFYERGVELKSLVGSLYSDWTDSFSTEVRISKQEVDMRQQSLDAASSFGEVQIRHNGATVYLGPDDSRQSNDLDYDSFNFKLAGTYYLDAHTITAGYEYEKLNVFNLFMQHTQGEFRFNSIEDFENGLASRVYYNNAAGTNNPNDVAANFSFAQHTFYVQDEYEFTDVDLTLTFGLRYDYYTSDDKPNYNPLFEERYGFSNQKNLDGIDLLQPRVGFNWQATDALEVRGGFGLYSGGNPNVWVSNSYSNDGVTQIATQRRNFNLFNNPMTDGQKPGFGVPQEMFDEVANTPIGSGDGSVNAIDPNFEIPSEWKFALGGSYTTEDNYIFSLDVLHSQKRNSAIVKDYSIAYAENKVAPDGRPMFEKLHNRGFNNDFVLTNVDGEDGESTIISTYAFKEWDNGITATLGYAYTDAKDVNPMTSSVAYSNYVNLASFDEINPAVATSNYEVPHRFTLQLGYEVEFFPGYATNFFLLGQASEGRPYSYTFDDSDGMFYSNGSAPGNRQLLYIPLIDDPNVVYGSDFNKDAFDQFIADNGLTRGAIVGRNSQNADWWVKFDLKVSQDIPGFWDGHKGQIYMTIKNLGNLLNDDWGVLKEGAFVGNAMVEASINDQGQYVYSRYSGNDALNVQNEASLWQMNVGISYKF